MLDMIAILCVVVAAGFVLYKYLGPKKSCGCGGSKKSGTPCAASSCVCQGQENNKAS